MMILALGYDIYDSPCICDDFVHTTCLHAMRK